MTTEKRQPVKKLRDGLLESAIWKNPTEKGHFYSATITTLTLMTMTSSTAATTTPIRSCFSFRGWPIKPTTLLSSCARRTKLQKPAKTGQAIQAHQTVGFSLPTFRKDTGYKARNPGSGD